MRLKKSYPFKIVIGYSGHQFDTSYNNFFKLCDSIVKKDISSDDWIEELDSAISKSIDPKYQWKKLHMMLCEKNVPSKAVIKIEDNFVRKIKAEVEEFPTVDIKKKVSEDVRNILSSLAGSSIFHLLSLL